MAARLAVLAFLAILQACVLNALAHGASASEDSELEVALHADDQCEGSESGACAFNALQFLAKHAEVKLETEAETETETELAGDIRNSFLTVYNKSLMGLRPFVSKLYANVGAQEKQVDYTMSVIAEAMNHSVNYDLSKGGFRHHKNDQYIQTLPAKTKYLALQVDYLQQLMVAFWDRYTIVDRKRLGCLNVVEAKVNGPKFSVGCVDLYVKCMPWAKHGMCESYSAYMTAKCPCSCKWIAEHPDWNKTNETNVTANASELMSIGPLEPKESLLQALVDLNETLAKASQQIRTLAEPNNWGATARERETHVVDLYKGLSADITDALNKTHYENIYMKEVDDKVQVWLGKTGGLVAE